MNQVYLFSVYVNNFKNYVCCTTVWGAWLVLAIQLEQKNYELKEIISELLR